MLVVNLQASPEVLDWNYRWPRIKAALAALQADVVCLNEVNHYHDDLQPAMEERGYSGVLLCT